MNSSLMVDNLCPAWFLPTIKPHKIKSEWKYSNLENDISMIWYVIPRTLLLAFCLVLGGKFAAPWVIMNTGQTLWDTCCFAFLVNRWWDNNPTLTCYNVVDWKFIASHFATCLREGKSLFHLYLDTFLYFYCTLYTWNSNAECMSSIKCWVFKSVESRV